MPAKLHQEPVRHEPQLIGRRILRFASVASTNTVAAKYAHDPANDGLVVTSAEQTAGRGRRGRLWHSPSGGLWLSVLLFPPAQLRRPVILTALCASAVCETIEKCTGLQPSIKWPNDILIENRKVCGILVEQGQGTVLGIGLNVNMPAETFVGELAHAASLRMFADRELDINVLFDCLVKSLDDTYAAAQRGDLTELRTNWRERFRLLGEQVSIQSQSGNHEGRLLDMGFDCVEWQDLAKGVSRLAPEEIEHITPLSSGTF